MSRKILVIEDDRDISKLLNMHLSESGYSVDCSYDGKAGLECAEKKQYDLIILDLMLPKIDGIEVCRSLRAKSAFPMILMLTARTSEVDRIVGLEMGADDYLTKPFSIQELLARVKALFRRFDSLSNTQKKQHDEKIHFEGLTIDAQKHFVEKKGVELTLTAKEFDLLLHFARNPGRVYTRDQLLEAVWGYGHEGYEHTVNSHMNRLRTKLEDDPTKPSYILTVWGVGYKFREAHE